MGLFDKIKDAAENITGQDFDQYLDKLPKDLGELFTGDFMSKFTQFGNIKDFFNAGNLKVDNLDDIKNVSMDTLNNLVKEKSQFGNWQEMLQKAGEIFLNK